MRKNFKSVIVVIAIILIISSTTIIASAAQFKEPTVQPMWDNIFSMSVDIAFEGAIGEATGIATRKGGASSLTIILRVYEDVEGEWVFVNEWTSTTTEIATHAVGEFPAESGVEYMATLTAVAYRNGIPEYDTVYAIRTCP